MKYPPAALLPAYPSFQEAQCASCNYANARPLVRSDVVSVPGSSVCVGLPHEREQGYWFPFHRISPRPVSTWPVQKLLRYMLAIFYYATCSLGLHRIWFSIYQLIPNERSSDLENAPTSRRSRWTETVQKMKRVWTLIIMVSSLLITWVLIVTKCSQCLYSSPGFPSGSSKSTISWTTSIPAHFLSWLLSFPPRHSLQVASSSRIGRAWIVFRSLCNGKSHRKTNTYCLPSIFGHV